METTRRSRAGDIQSVHRAVDLLEAIGAEGELGVTELAQRLELAVSTVHNLLRTLAHRGYVLARNGRYSLGPGVTVLTAQWDPTVALASLIKPELRRITVETGHAATATAVVGRDAHLIGFEPAPGLVTASSSGWRWRNPLALATGRVVVALAREPEWSDFVAAGDDAEPGWSQDRWYAELAEIAASGVSIKQAEDDRGQAVAIGVPVWGRGDVVVAAVGCSAAGSLPPDDRGQEILDTLWAIAAELSTRLGCETIPRPHPRIPLTGHNEP